MVVFTCNNCGDSVNKPKVEKHIQYECKRKHFAVSFCCVDCLKDFNQETVKDHCQCVTEEQRYSAKGFVPKASAEKGKRKQAGWVDIVQSVINRKDLSNDEKQFLSIITKFDNVPRKKNKFQNFCFSSAPAYRRKEHLVNKVFDMIEAEYKAQTQISNEKLSNNDNKPKTNDTDNLKKNDSIQEEHLQKINKKRKDVENDEEKENNDGKSEEVSKKKKKKKKQSIDMLNDEIKIKSEENDKLQSKKKDKKSLENNINAENDLALKEANAEIISEETVLPKSEKKKKKKKKSIGNNITSEGSLTLEESNSVETELDSTIKSSKKKKNLQVETNNFIENGITNTDSLNTEENSLLNGKNAILDDKTEFQMSKKEKKEMKKKMKYQHELASVTNGVIEAVSEPICKKKKRKLNNNVENEEPQQKISKTEMQPERKFEWNEAINQVLMGKKDKPISLNKVMKRVMNEYHLLNETTKKTESELEKIFRKKIKKMKNVKIDNDKVHLI
ncbi:cell growth-regulating nucleolar protein isoform X2 [Sipha flava]|uniref:Cell growth-regulating nucleolar protein isoform X2 n=1 Tax=Sipha flava TaxID=143950 RepID=A0A8B8FG63_9HEMI|nr:cell growth-regulating nucleolar protein isoform X2 [Sipha flava]